MKSFKYILSLAVCLWFSTSTVHAMNVNYWNDLASWPAPNVESTITSILSYSEEEFIYTATGYNSAIYDTVNDSWRVNGSGSGFVMIGTFPSYAGDGKGNFYSAGGGTYNAWEKTLRIYNIKTGETRIGAPMPTARGSAVNHVYNKGKIYVIGGFIATKAPPTNQVDNGRTTAVEIYDIESNTWSSGAPLDIGRGAFEHICINDKIYIIGGSINGLIPSNGTNHTNRVDVYDIATNSWSKGPNLPTGIGNSAVVEKDGIIYIIGGHTNTKGNGVKRILSADTKNFFFWNTKATPLVALQRPGGVVSGNKIYIAGGAEIPSNANYHYRMQVYDIESDTWTQSAGGHGESVNSPIMVPYGNRVYAVFGTNAGTVLDGRGFAGKRFSVYVDDYIMEEREIVFDAAGGNNLSFETKQLKGLEPYGELPTVKKSGHSFVGWFVRTEGQERRITSESIRYHEDDPTIRAHWIDLNRSNSMNDSAGKWQYLEAAPFTDFGTVSAFFNNKVYVITYPQSGTKRSFYRYDTILDEWAQLNDLTSSLPYCSMEVLDNQLYLLAGSNFRVYDEISDSWAAKNVLPFLVEPHSTGVINNTLYAVARSYTAGLEGWLYKYDPLLDSWINTSHRDLGIKRGEGSMCAVGNELFFVGGSGTYARKTRSYNVSDGSVKIHMDAVGNGHYTQPSLASLGNSLYVFAYGFSQHDYGDIFMYNTTTEKWYETTGSNFEKTGFYFTAAASENNLYAVGRVVGDVSYFEKYTPSSNAWNTLPAPADFRTMSVLVDGKLYLANQGKLWRYDLTDFSYNSLVTKPGSIFGGRLVSNGDSIFSAGNDLYCYSISTGMWTKLKDPPLGVQGAVLVSDTIYAWLGGLTDWRFAKYSILSNEWTLLSSAPKRIGNFPGLSYKDGKVYVTGGSFDSTGDFLCYDIVLDEWEFLERSPLFELHGSSVILDDHLYTAGGDSFQRFNLTSGEWEISATLPTACTAAVIHEYNGDLYFVAGYGVFSTNPQNLNKAVRYSISYSGNGSLDELPSDVRLYSFGEIAEIMSGVTLKGHTFLGWGLDLLTTDFYQPGETLSVVEDIILYARWLARSDIKVIFDVNGGNPVGVAFKNVTFSAQYGDLPEPDRVGYDFLGWSHEIDLEE